jgi:hypothetical protein
MNTTEPTGTATHATDTAPETSVAETSATPDPTYPTKASKRSLGLARLDRP